MDRIGYWIEAEGEGNNFFILFFICLLFLFLWFKGRRTKLLLPSMIMTAVIINPLFYNKWDELGLYAYWRVLWALPIIPIIATVVPSLTEKLNKLNRQPRMKTVWKAMCVAIGVSVVMLGGPYIYNGEEGKFEAAENIEKLPKDVIEIANQVLELNEHPRIIALGSIGVYIRQYTGEIITLYGRDLYGYITDEPNRDALTVINQLDNEQFNDVAQFMLDKGYDYIIYEGVPDDNFLWVGDSELYEIYSPVGAPTVKNIRNELGLVIATTTIDQDGCLVNNFFGYATIHREYDSYGNIIFEYYTDKEGNLVQQQGGYYKLEQTYDSKGHLLSRTYLGKEDEPVTRIDGYSKVQWKTDNKGTRNVCFYDQDGSILSINGKNLVRDVKIGLDGWSEWMSPQYNETRQTFNIGIANLDEREVGDTYISQFEIEFSGVTATEGQTFRFYAQGSTDGVWGIGNIWDGSLVWFGEPPANWVYRCVCKYEMTEELIKINNFSLGFRCDNWASGSFRVRNVKIEKGDTPSVWSPGL